MPKRNKNKGLPRVEKDERARDLALAGLHLLERYRPGKRALELEMADNERRWELKDSEGKSGSGWMFNSIAAKHSDAMDSIPTVTVLPREVSDIESAGQLSEILPALFDRCDFEKTWSDCWYDKLKHGCAVYGIFWDPLALGGLGDVSVRRVDLCDLYWEPGVSDIQDSASVFHVTYCTDQSIISLYPELEKTLSGGGYTPAVDINGSRGPERHAVIDRYYKKRINGRTVLHFCRSVCGTVVYASEKDPAYRERGYYDHGRYPFVFDSLFACKGTPCGFGLTRLLKSGQEHIDKLESAMVENARMAAYRRYFAREASGINEEEFTDWTSPIVHYSGSGDPSDSVMPINVTELDGACLDLLEYKVREIKEVSGNRDFNQGGTNSGVTAASAIEALQEAGNKLSRDMIKQSYRAYEEVCTLMIELIRQFYTLPRCFRITSAEGDRFTEFDNRGISVRKQGVFGDRLPSFDITARAVRQSPYTKAALNELAREFFAAGMFAPERRDEALFCLEMMDFEGRERMIELIKNRGGAT